MEERYRWRERERESRDSVLSEQLNDIYIYIYIMHIKCIEIKKNQGLQRMILFVEIFANVEHFGF